MGLKPIFYAMKSKNMSTNKYQKLKTNQTIAFFQGAKRNILLSDIIAKATLQASNYALQLQVKMQRHAYFSPQLNIYNLYLLFLKSLTKTYLIFLLILYLLKVRMWCSEN